MKVWCLRDGRIESNLTLIESGKLYERCESHHSLLPSSSAKNPLLDFYATRRRTISKELETNFFLVNQSRNTQKGIPPATSAKDKASHTPWWLMEES